MGRGIRSAYLVGLTFLFLSLSSLTTLLYSLIYQASKRGPVLFLDSSESDHPEAQNSYLALGAVIELKCWGNQTLLLTDKGISRKKENPWNALQQIKTEYPGWWFGYFGYELNELSLNNWTPTTPEQGLPELYFFQPKYLLQITALGEWHWLTEPPEWISDTFELPELSCTVEELVSNVSLSRYTDIIRHIKKDIFEGEYYEMNFCRTLHARFKGEPLALYRKMRFNGGVPFGAFLHLGDAAIVSISPERFLKKEKNELYSDPIKGTAKRYEDPQRDAVEKHLLATSLKNQAENLMIVDLVRNDLSIISEPNSVKVEKLFEIQSFGTVHQMVSRVSAQLKPDVNCIDALKTCFPMGSMTGAPKKAAMTAIKKYEPEARGVYSGALGYITPEDDFDFNVLIRTAVIQAGKLSYGVGGAITADSVPEEEWQETEVKSLVLKNAVD